MPRKDKCDTDPASRRDFLRMGALLAVGVGLRPALGQEPPAPGTTTQPATTTPPEQSTLRKPDEAAILKNLLRQQDRATPILPAGPAEATSQASRGGPQLLLEGTFLMERPARLIYEGDQPQLAIQADVGAPKLETMTVLENQLLEMMEREAQAGFTEFVVSAEVTRYRGRNYLLLRKVLRRVGHGNLSP